MADGSISTIPVPPGYDVPAVPAFAPDRLGVRRVSIEIDRTTGVIKASGTPCPATATTWGPTDAPELTTADLVAELMRLPDGAAKTAALTALPAVQSGLVAIFAALLSGRE